MSVLFGVWRSCRCQQFSASSSDQRTAGVRGDKTCAAEAWVLASIWSATHRQAHCPEKLKHKLITWPVLHWSISWAEAYSRSNAQPVTCVCIGISQPDSKRRLKHAPIHTLVNSFRVTFLLKPVRKRFSDDHWRRWRCKPGSQTVGSSTSEELITVADCQSSRQRLDTEAVVSAAGFTLQTRCLESRSVGWWQMSLKLVDDRWIPLCWATLISVPHKF